jgi:hypothetical protein
MECRSHNTLGTRLFLALILLVVPAAAAVSGDSVPWRKLEFERRSVWGTANSQIELSEKAAIDFDGSWQKPGNRDYLLPTGSRLWELNVDASVGRNQARLQLILEPSTTAIYQRDRLTIGRRDRRNKFYRYAADSVTRVRSEPQPGELSQPPDQWSQSSVQEIAFPALPAGAVVTSPYALLILASSIPLEQDSHTTVYVHTDFNLYRVVMQRGEDSQLQMGFLLHDSEGGSQHYEEVRPVQTIRLLAQPTAQTPAKPDFELLGLKGDLQILVDTETRLPLRVMGTAPRVGKAHLDLKSAVLPETGNLRQ